MSLGTGRSRTSGEILAEATCLKILNDSISCSVDSLAQGTGNSKGCLSILSFNFFFFNQVINISSLLLIKCAVTF